VSEKGFVRNCFVRPRLNSATAGSAMADTSTMFQFNSDLTLMACLDGYAIIPLEEYEELIGKKISLPTPTGENGFTGNRIHGYLGA
jgi:hypothetical protein